MGGEEFIPEEVIKEAEGSTKTESEEPKKEELKSTDDPVEFMQAFYSSDEYNKGFQHYLDTRQRPFSDDVTEEEKHEAYRRQHDAAVALHDFGQHTTHLEYNSDKFPPLSQELMRDYIEVVREMRKAYLNGEEKSVQLFLDRQRRVAHRDIADQLVKDGVVSSESLGKALARRVLVDLKLEDENNIRISDAERARNLVA